VSPQPAADHSSLRHVCEHRYKDSKREAGPASSAAAAANRATVMSLLLWPRSQTGTGVQLSSMQSGIQDLNGLRI
jgi:hypothetical protein